MGLFRMPSLGSDMEDGRLVEWLVKPGDAVKRGDVIAVVETQKGAIEIEVFESGRVARLIAEIGRTLPVGAPMAEIEGAGAPAAEAPPPEAEAPPPEAQAPPPKAEAPSEPEPEPEPAPTPGPAARPRPAPPSRPAPAPAAPAPSGAGGPAPASPAARVRAREAGLDLSALSGSGPGGAVLLADVERAAAEGSAAGAAPAPRRSRFDPAAMRAAVAAAMSRSKREIPHYYLAHDIDLQPAADWLEARNADRPPAGRLLTGLLLVRAAARAAAAAPQVNGTFEDGEFRPSQAVHAGVAVALRGGGLVAPALHDADSRDLDDLMAGMRDLVSRARSGRLRSSEISGPTLTVSSLGERGADALFGVIFPPQVALVGFGTPVARPAVTPDGAVVPRLTVTATLAADHRVSDGRLGAGYLAGIADLLQNPEAL